MVINVKGILIPFNWNQKGNVVSVAIATNDEKEYLVEDQAVAEKLKRLRSRWSMSVVSLKKCMEKTLSK